MTVNKKVIDRPIVATPNAIMGALQIGRAKLYELINSGLLESYLEGKSRKITWRSVEAYVQRRLEEEAKRRGQKRSRISAAADPPEGQNAAE